MARKKKVIETKELPPKPLRGFISTGILYIGDPGNLAGNLNDPSVLEDRGRVTRADNPFFDYEYFLHTLDNKDKNLAFSGGNPNNDGMGVAIQLNNVTGKYIITKEKDDQGNVTRVIVDILP